MLELLQKSGIREKSSHKEGIREELRMAINNDFQRNPIEEIETSWWDTQLPNVDELIRAKMLYSSESLTPKQMTQGIENIRDHLGEMQFFRWKEFPLSLTLDEWSTSVNGMISIPYNFGIDELLEYLDQHETAMKEKRGLSVQALAEKIVDLTEKVEKICAKLVCPSDLAATSLAVCLEKLHKAGNLLTFLSIEIGTKASAYRLSNAGLLTIPFNFEEKDLVTFLGKFGDEKIGKIRRYHQTIQRIQEQCIKLANEIMNVVKLKELDVTTMNTAHPFDKLSWLEYLRDNALHLTRFEWSEWSYVLTDENEVFIDGTTVYIPIKFDVLLMVDAVVNKNVKKSKYDDLIEKEDDGKRETDLTPTEYNKIIAQAYRDLPELLEMTKDADIGDLDEEDADDYRMMTETDQIKLGAEKLK